ncbi:hypothetical protein [Caballeronia humi]|uniref:Uncharacterized protein n=1 Tax=Caballeronia humi TaxID=326474 RepID=A0A158HLB6_9BURK|nr:hypothetical protein [Caballeronia humi]SAL45174.1 hypothetical protein AWB65_03513 [Caballeronia humi]
MTKKRGPRCVLIAYDEDEQSILTCTVPRDAVSGLMNSELVVPLPLSEERFRLGDEFARQLGGVALLWLSIEQPELKPFIEVTQAPEPPPVD